MPEFSEEAAHALDHAGRGLRTVGRPYEDVEGPEFLLLKAESLPNAALDAVAVRSTRGVLARDQHAEPRAACIARSYVKRETVEAAPSTLAKQAFELCLLPQPAAGIQPEALYVRGYNPRRRRPLARRLRSTLRPPGVRPRTRNPWRRARRVLDGW